MTIRMIPLLWLLFWLAACSVPAGEQVTSQDLSPTVSAVPARSPMASAETATPPAVTPPVYRGPALQATDPALLTFESGRPQFVEFFRFT